MGKRVGIMTLYYKTYNYGAQLQCYALQRTLAKMGYEAELIRFRWYKTELDRYYRYACHGNYDKFEAFAKGIPHSERVYTPENIHECVDLYDIFVCGSDQIWGVTKSMPSYVLPQITLSFVPDNKVKIAYAASAGGREFEPFVETAIRNALRRLDSISVRERGLIPAVEELAKKKAVSALDPTMLLSVEEWDTLAVLPKEEIDYIFVYNIGDNKHLESTAQLLSKELNCEIKTISYSPNDTPGPLEFIGLIKHAKYVLANSLHGTIFSILYRKEFCAFALDDIEGALSKNIRLAALLELFGLSDRFINEDSDLSSKRHIDYSSVEDKLYLERGKSFNYLACALQSEREEVNNSESKNVFADTPHPVRNYLMAIANGKSDSELFYEQALVEKELEIERLSYELDKEVLRNDIILKLCKCQTLGYSLTDMPNIKGDVFIYGAGKIGRIASHLLGDAMVGFIDKSPALTESGYCEGFPIYHPDSALFQTIMRQREENMTVLVTPVWDMDIIRSELLIEKGVNLVSIGHVLKDI